MKLVSPDRRVNTDDPAEKKAGGSAGSKRTLLLSVALSFLAGAYSASLVIGRVGALIPLMLLIPLGVAAVLSAVSNM